MVQVLPRVEKRQGFGEAIGSSLGQGLGMGLNRASEMVGQSMLDRQKMDQRQSLINQIETGSGQKQNNFSQQIMQAIPQIEQQLGFKLTEDQIESIGHQMNGDMQPSVDNQPEDPFAKAKQYASIGEHDLSNVAAKEAESRISQKSKERDFHTGRAFKFLDKISEASDKIPEREASLNSAFSAIESGQLHPLGGDFWANLTGLDALRTESGAQLNASAKNNLIASLGRLSGGRPNQFIEKQISDAFAKTGETKGAQKAKLLMSRAVLDMDKNLTETSEKIAAEHRDKYGYPLENIAEESNRVSKSGNQIILKKLAYDLRRNMEESMKPDDFNKLTRVSPGTPLTLEKAAVILRKAPGKTDEEKEANAMKMAKKAGYEIPEQFVYEGR